MNIDRESPIPLYYQLKQDLFKQIKNNELEKGDRLLSEEELISKYELSRFTVRQALQELENEGWVERKRGKGTFISEPKISLSVAWQLLGFSEDMRRKGHKIESKIVEQKVKEADKEIAKSLKIEKGVPVLFINRLRYVDGEPFVIDHIYLRMDLMPGIEEIDMTNQSLFHIFEKKYEIKITNGIRTLKIALADNQIAAALELKQKEPLFLLTDLIISEGNLPIHMSDTYIAEKNSEFIFNLVRPDNINELENINITSSTYPAKKE